MLTNIGLAYWIAANGRPQRPTYNTDGTFSIMEEDAYGREVEITRLPDDLMILFKSDYFAVEEALAKATTPRKKKEKPAGRG